MVPVSSGQVRSLVHGGTSSTSSNSSLSNNPSVTITLQVSPSGSSGPMDQGPSAAKQLVQQQHSPPMGHSSAPSPPSTSYVKQNCDQQATIGYSANASLVIRPSSMGPSVPGVSPHPHQQLTAAAVSPSGGGGAAVGRPFVMTPLASSIQAHGSAASSSSSMAAVQAAASHQAAVQAVLATAASTAPHHSHHPHHHQTCLSEAVTITID